MTMTFLQAFFAVRIIKEPRLWSVDLKGSFYRLGYFDSKRAAKLFRRDYRLFLRGKGPRPAGNAAKYAG